MKSPCCRVQALCHGTRLSKANNRIRRRRCGACGEEFTTVEYLVTEVQDGEEVERA